MEPWLVINENTVRGPVEGFVTPTVNHGTPVLDPVDGHPSSPYQREAAAPPSDEPKPDDDAAAPPSDEPKPDDDSKPTSPSPLPRSASNFSVGQLDGQTAANVPIPGNGVCLESVESQEEAEAVLAEQETVLQSLDSQVAALDMKSTEVVEAMQINLSVVAQLANFRTSELLQGLMSAENIPAVIETRQTTMEGGTPLSQTRTRKRSSSCATIPEIELPPLQHKLPLPEGDEFDDDLPNKEREIPPPVKVLLEQVVDAGQSALASQEALVIGITTLPDSSARSRASSLAQHGSPSSGSVQHQETALRFRSRSGSQTHARPSPAVGSSSIPEHAVSSPSVGSNAPADTTTKRLGFLVPFQHFAVSDIETRLEDEERPESPREHPFTTAVDVLTDMVVESLEERNVRVEPADAADVLQANELPTTTAVLMDIGQVHGMEEPLLAEAIPASGSVLFAPLTNQPTSMDSPLESGNNEGLVAYLIPAPESISRNWESKQGGQSDVDVRQSMLAIPSLPVPSEDRSWFPTSNQLWPPAIESAQFGIVKTEINGVSKARLKLFIVNRTPVAAWLALLLILTTYAMAPPISKSMGPGISAINKSTWKTSFAFLLSIPLWIRARGSISLPTIAKFSSMQWILVFVQIGVFNSMWGVTGAASYNYTTIVHASLLGNLHSVLMTVKHAILKEPWSWGEAIGAFISLVSSLLLVSVTDRLVTDNGYIGDLLAIISCFPALGYFIAASVIQPHAPVFYLIAPLQLALLISLTLTTIIVDGTEWTSNPDGLYGWLDESRGPQSLGLALLSFVPAVGFVVINKYFHPLIGSLVVFIEPIILNLVAWKIGWEDPPNVGTFVCSAGMLFGIGTSGYFQWKSQQTVAVDVDDAMSRIQLPSAELMSPAVIASSPDSTKA